MSILAYFLLHFWLPLGVGLALFLALCRREQKLRNRVLVMLGFVIIWTAALCVTEFHDTYQPASHRWANPLITLAAVGPTFVVSWLGYEVASKVSESSWIRVGIASILGLPMVVLSVLFFLGSACDLVGECL
jgi:hypothetical protein